MSEFPLTYDMPSGYLFTLETVLFNKNVNEVKISLKLSKTTFTYDRSSIRAPESIQVTIIPKSLGGTNSDPNPIAPSSAFQSDGKVDQTVSTKYWGKKIVEERMFSYLLLQQTCPGIQDALVKCSLPNHIYDDEAVSIIDRAILEEVGRTLRMQEMKSVNGSEREWTFAENDGYIEATRAARFLAAWLPTIKGNYPKASGISESLLPYYHESLFKKYDGVRGKVPITYKEQSLQPGPDKTAFFDITHKDGKFGCHLGTVPGAEARTCSVEEQVPTKELGGLIESDYTQDKFGRTVEAVGGGWEIVDG